MNRLIFNALLMLSSPSSVMGFSPQKLNTKVPGVDSLKSNVEKSFLEKANNPKSQLNKTLTIFTGLTQKFSESLIYVTAKEPRAPRFRRACVSPNLIKTIPMEGILVE